MKDKSNSLYICICILFLVLGFHLGANIEDEIVAYFRVANIDANNVITACGIIITSMFAFFGLKEARRNTRLQSEPFLYSLQETDYGKNTYQFYLINSGAGSVIKMSYSLFHNDEQISLDMLRFKLRKITHKDESLKHSYSTPEAIPAGIKSAFINLNLENIDENKFASITNFLADLTLSINYETVLGEVNNKTFKLYK